MNKTGNNRGRFQQRDDRGDRSRFQQRNSRNRLDGKINKLISTKLTKMRITAPENIMISNDIKPYDLDAFILLKKNLNEKKSEMDKFFTNEKLSDSFTKITHAIRITNTLRYTLQKEYNGQHVTRAWLKFYELIVHFNIVKISLGDAKKLKIFFNAELPGAGVCAVNHLMKTYYSNIYYDWVASSLVLGKNMQERVSALGDIYGIWEHNKDNWLMDVADNATEYQNNGDVTSIKNILDMKNKIGDEKPGIYMHDAGIDVSSAFEELEEQTGFNTQEYKNMKIHFGCAVAALETLKIGGCFVAKQYTFFESFTINLIIIYASMFEEFYICKPTTSGHSNSEIYLVGLKFKGYPEKFSTVFTERMENWNINPFISKEDIESQEFSESISQILRYARIRNTEQKQYINESIEIFNLSMNPKTNMPDIAEVKNYMHGISEMFSQNWIKTYTPRRIDDDDYIAAAN